MLLMVGASIAISFTAKMLAESLFRVPTVKKTFPPESMLEFAPIVPLIDPV